MPPTNEPERLRRGKSFHKKIQSEWLKTAEGEVIPEKNVHLIGGKRGRVDIFVNDDEPDGAVAVIEIKASNWDIMTPKAVRRNARRQIRQIWKYIESQIYKGEYVSTGEEKSVSPGIIFPNLPKDKNRRNQIEEMFEEEGITVVWDDKPD